MIPLVFVAALLMLALATQAGVMALQRLYPAQGDMIEVAGATLHVVDIGPRDAPGPPIVLIHGASSNLQTMRKPIGDRLAARHRVILIDRPGHGWSSRAREDDSTPAIQGKMIEQVLEKLGVGPVILVVHSWAGALGARMALDYPHRIAGLVMLAPVAFPWPGGVGWYNNVVTTPVIGPLLAYTITLPLGYFLMEQAPRYANIKAPTVVISGDVDKTVSTDIHSRPFAAAVADARLIVLPGVGHMVQNAAPELVVAEIEAVADKITRSTAAAN